MTRLGLRLILHCSPSNPKFRSVQSGILARLIRNGSHALRDILSRRAGRITDCDLAVRNAGSYNLSRPSPENAPTRTPASTSKPRHARCCWGCSEGGEQSLRSGSLNGAGEAAGARKLAPQATAFDYGRVIAVRTPAAPTKQPCAHAQPSNLRDDMRAEPRRPLRGLALPQLRRGSISRFHSTGWRLSP